MSLSSISSQLPRVVEQQNMEHRIRANGDGCSTVFKVMMVVASAFITLGAFVLGGPITGVIVALLCGVSLLGLFNGNVPSPHATWFLSGNPPGRGFDPHHPHGRGHVPHDHGPHVPGHVVVRGGHMYPAQPPAGGAPHVGPGMGHFHPAPPPGAGPNVGVGRGHNHGGPTNPPPPSGPDAPRPGVGEGRGRRG